MIKYSASAMLISINLLGLFLFTWPLYLDIEKLGFTELTQATWLAAVFALIAIMILALAINARLLDSKTVAIVSVLVALISALRLLGAGAVGIEPIWFLIILATRALGVQIGFVIAILALSVSALISGGIGPWLPFQILAAGWVALGVAFIPRNISLKLERTALALYGVVAAFGFGFLMDLQLWPWLLGSDTQLSYLPGGGVSENLSRFITFHFATALSWDLPRAIVTATLILITAKPILAALTRARYRLDSVAQWREFNERAKAGMEA